MPLYAADDPKICLNFLSFQKDLFLLSGFPAKTLKKIRFSVWFRHFMRTRQWCRNEDQVCVFEVEGRSIRISYCACVKCLPMVMIKCKVGRGYEEGSYKHHDAVRGFVCFFCADFVCRCFYSDFCCADFFCCADVCAQISVRILTRIFWKSFLGQGDRKETTGRTTPPPQNPPQNPS